MADGPGFWGLKPPPAGRAPRAAVWGPPGAFFKAILEASAYVEYYDEELEYEPWRRGVETSTLTTAALSRRLPGQGNQFACLVGYRSLPAAFLRGPAVCFSPFANPEAPAPLSLVIGARRGGKAPGPEAPQVVTAREVAAGTGGVPLPAGDLDLLVIDPLVMDPSLLPLPSNLEPGGLLWHPFTGLLRSLFERCDVSAVHILPCTLPRRSPVPAFVLARLLSKILAYALAGTAQRGR